MGMIKEDFTTIYEINTIGAIKSWKETKVDGVTYPPSVKFRSTSIEEKMDADVGIREIETNIEFGISVDTLENANLLKEAIRNKRINKELIYISGNLPRYENSDQLLKVKSSEPLELFLKRNGIDLSKTDYKVVQNNQVVKNEK